MTPRTRLLREVAADLKLYAFFLLLLGAARGAFVFTLREFIGRDASAGDFALAVTTGARFDMKTAAFITAVSFIAFSLPAAFRPAWPAPRLRGAWGFLWVFVIVALVHVRIAYYQEFRDVLGEYLFNTFKDDPRAIAQTIYVEYNLPLRLLSIAATSLLAMAVLRAWMGVRLLSEAAWRQAAALRRRTRAALTLGFAVMLVLSIRGRALGIFKLRDAYVTEDVFLNHAVLDDVNAVRYAYQAHRKLIRSQALALHPDAVSAALGTLAAPGAPGHEIDSAFLRTAGGARLAAPRHIFVILGESLASWPLSPSYDDLHIADGLKGLMADPESIALLRFLPSSSGTMTSLASIVTGNADQGVYTNYQPQSRMPYATSMAPQFRRLGYRTRIYYAGFPSWQRIESFAKAQGFDEVYCANRTGAAAEAWGVPDGDFLRAVARDFNDDVSSFNLILTVSNHAPFTHDVAAEGFPLAAVREKLLAKGFDDPKLPLKVGHYWYADRALTSFVRTMRERFPASLFAITGDHAQRYRAATSQSLEEELTVPLILLGAGLRKDLLPPTAVGSHLQIAPTLIELVAPAGFTYASLLPSLTAGAPFGFHRDAWISADYLAWVQPNRPSPGFPATPTAAEAHKAARAQHDALRTISAWRIIKGSRYVP